MDRIGICKICGAEFKAGTRGRVSQWCPEHRAWHKRTMRVERPGFKERMRAFARIVDVGMTWPELKAQMGELEAEAAVPGNPYRAVTRVPSAVRTAWRTDVND